MSVHESTEARRIAREGFALGRSEFVHVIDGRLHGSDHFGMAG
jgi:hypothetical protein